VKRAPTAYSGGGKMTPPHKWADPWYPQALPVRNAQGTAHRKRRVPPSRENA
jgi:hypothetical protein